MNHNQRQKLLFARSLAPFLGRIVHTPSISPRWNKMRLVEIYSNGNVACLPLNATDYHGELKEYHAFSIKEAQ